MSNNTPRIALRFVTDLLRSFYSTFYSAGSGWFIVTVTVTVCLYFASSSGSPALANAFNLIVLPWQIAFLIYVVGAARKFFSERWAAARRSISK
jgi:hypothetical protein